MPLSAQFDNVLHIVTFQLTAPTRTVAELMAEYEKLLQSPSLTDNMHSIWDISDLGLTRIPLVEIRRLPHAMNAMMPRRGSSFRAAIVSTRGPDHVLLGAYLLVLKLIGGVRFGLFRSIDEARHWILAATTIGDARK